MGDSRPTTTSDELHKLQVRVDDLERLLKSSSAAPGTLAGLKDVKVSYKDAFSKPANLSELEWRDLASSPYGGFWTPGRDRTIIRKLLHTDGVGNIGLGASLVGDDWDPSRPCLVTLNAAITPGTYAEIFDSLTWDVTDPDGPPPHQYLYLYAEEFTATDLEGEDYELASWVHYADVHGGSGTNEGSVSHLFSSGTPTISYGVGIDSSLYPGNHTLVVSSRVLPL